MLYNPKWSTTPSLDGFIAWLREQDPDEEYSYMNCERCACGQYTRSIGMQDWHIHAQRGSEEMQDLLTTLNELASSALNTRPTTFGALLSRALAYRASL